MDFLHVKHSLYTLKGVFCLFIVRRTLPQVMAKIRWRRFTGNGKPKPKSLKEAELRPWFLCDPKVLRADFSLFSALNSL